MKLETNEVLWSTSFKPYEITKTNHYSGIMSQSTFLFFLASFLGVLLSSGSFFVQLIGALLVGHQPVYLLLIVAVRSCYLSYVSKAIKG